MVSSDESPTTPNLDRREFAEVLALAALAPALGLDSTVLRRVSIAPIAASVESAEPGGLAKALAGVIRAQYGERLSEADLTTITQQIAAGLERAEKIRKVALTNGDEPDFVFSAARAGHTS